MSEGAEPGKAATDVALIAGISAIPTILRILCDTTGLGFGAVARVTGTSWTACAVLDRIGFGLGPGGQLDVITTFCHDIHSSKTPIVIEQASEDKVYANHPTPKLYGFESYIAVPIIRGNGEFFGTICALDPKPAMLSDAQLLPTLQLFAELIATQIEIEERLESSRSALTRANKLGVLRDQFIAVLGHDLRNPIAAVAAGLDLLSRRPLDSRATTLVGHMKQSTWRMSELVNNVLDFARGRLGSGIPVQRRETSDLALTLLQIIEELRSVYPHCVIESEFTLLGPIVCDPERIGQLLSNLLANALTHGARDKPVRITATGEAGGLTLTVSNEGPDISEETLAHLFLPFTRAEANGKPAGLGLGLYIASEIARSHNGSLSVFSSVGTTAFTLDLPRHPD